MAEIQRLGDQIVGEIESLPVRAIPILYEGTEFSMEKYLFITNELVRQSEGRRMNIQLYVDFYYECLKLFLHFGSAIKLAFKDIQEKADRIKGNRDLLAEKGLVGRGSPEHTFIEEFVDFEFARKLAFLNSDNNKKVLKEAHGGRAEELERWMFGYQSTAWVFIKGAWLFDYMYGIFSLMVQDREMTLTNIASKAYDVALAPHHNWFLQRAARMGIMACTSRQNFLKSLCEEQTRIAGGPAYTQQAFYRDMNQLVPLFKRLSEHIWGFYERKGIKDDIP
uniref:Glycolipid transfer protein domain-containing protein n=1 Tax=Strombidium rassoulzadegani TaxID=1082188 RepID=A0A7S3FU91_9SPIT|mmetsp:Transcript_18659/g.31916  ORF Transcript_18659/g.31916 Transcript_18659/m.31916 type:complete len:279 (+) Transcript_18659:316-1152(+)